MTSLTIRKIPEGTGIKDQTDMHITSIKFCTQMLLSESSLQIVTYVVETEILT